MAFKPGDVVRRKDGTDFGNCKFTNVVREPPKGSYYWHVNDDTYTWVKYGWVSTKNLELVEEKEMEKEFKVGDTVKIVKNESSSRNKVGDIGVVRDISSYGHCAVLVKGRSDICNWHQTSDLELVKTVEYEDKWHLNDGSSTIPDDADKLEKDGSVVAYRLRKKELFKFGDKVKTTLGELAILVADQKPGNSYVEIITEKSVTILYACTSALTKVTD